MKRLILEMGSGADLYGMDYTKAAIRAFNDAIRHSSITLFSSLGINHTEMDVKITIGVQEPDKVNLDELRAQVPRGNPSIIVLFGGQNIDSRSNGDFSVIATCAIEAYVPDLSERFSIIRAPKNV
jgi:uncharacterized protein (TIGR02058 family)